MLKLDFIDAKHNKESIKDLKKLYKEAFPKNEQVPFWLLKRLSKKENVEFYGIYEESKFAGLVYNVIYKDIVFIFYLAIDKNARGNGYGGKILSSLKEKYKNHRIVLNIEEVDENRENFEQRKRRKNFYIKNGFYDLNYTIKEYGEDYEMLCYNEEGKHVSKEEYMCLMRNYFGDFLYNFVYKKISE